MCYNRVRDASVQTQGNFGFLDQLSLRLVPQVPSPGAWRCSQDAAGDADRASCGRTRLRGDGRSRASVLESSAYPGSLPDCLPRKGSGIPYSATRVPTPATVALPVDTPLYKYLQGLDSSDELGTGVSVRVGELPTIWPEPLVNRYDWGEPSPIACAERRRSVRVVGSVPAGVFCH